MLERQAIFANIDRWASFAHISWPPAGPNAVHINRPALSAGTVVHLVAAAAATAVVQRELLFLLLLLRLCCRSEAKFGVLQQVLVRTGGCVLRILATWTWLGLLQDMGGPVRNHYVAVGCFYPFDHFDLFSWPEKCDQKLTGDVQVCRDSANPSQDGHTA